MLTLNPINSIEYYSDLASEDYYHAGGEPAGRWAGAEPHCSVCLAPWRPTLISTYYAAITPTVKRPFAAKPGIATGPAGISPSAPPSRSAWSGPALSPNYNKRSKPLTRLPYWPHWITSNNTPHSLGAATTARTRETTAGLVIATFEHGTSRDLDPTLHTHSLVCNLSPRTDESWGTLESRDLYLWQRSAGGGPIAPSWPFACKVWTLPLSPTVMLLRWQTYHRPYAGIFPNAARPLRRR